MLSRDPSGTVGDSGGDARSQPAMTSSSAMRDNNIQETMPTEATSHKTTTTKRRKHRNRKKRNRRPSFLMSTSASAAEDASHDNAIKESVEEATSISQQPTKRSSRVSGMSGEDVSNLDTEALVDHRYVFVGAFFFFFFFFGWEGCC